MPTQAALQRRGGGGEPTSHFFFGERLRAPFLSQPAWAGPSHGGFDVRWGALLGMKPRWALGLPPDLASETPWL